MVLTILSAGLLSGCPSSDADGPDGTSTTRATTSTTAPVTGVTGTACGYIVNVGLFAGPQELRGCGQAPGAPAAAVSPAVALPAEGSATAITAADADGAAAQYGPAVIMGGRWPDNAAAAPPTGPISVSAEGTSAGRSVTSSARIGLHPTPVTVGCSTGTAPPCVAPGGFGPSPVEGDELVVTCTATEAGATGSTTFRNTVHATSTTPEGAPKDTEAVPDTPPPNYTRSGVITNVGDVFTAVYNEQITNPDGSLTVNGVHMYLFGPTAVGEVIKGQATCGLTPARTPAKDTQPPVCGTLVVAPLGPQDPTPKTPRTELVGVFDTGGLEAIRDVKAANGTVQPGSPNGSPYLRQTPGQTGPLAVTATRSAEAERGNLPLEWSFEAVDRAGNTTRCPTTRAP